MRYLLLIEKEYFTHKNLLQVVDILQTTVQPSHKYIYHMPPSVFVVWWANNKNGGRHRGWGLSCNARHKDIKNKRILPQKQPKITNFITSRQQIYFRRQSNRHTAHIFSFFFLCIFFVEQTKKVQRKKKPGGWWRFSATPAIRTFKNKRILS